MTYYRLSARLYPLEVTSLGLFVCFWSGADKKVQTRAHQWIARVKKRKGFGCSFGRIGVVLSQCPVGLRTKKLRNLFHGLPHNNQATRELTIE